MIGKATVVSKRSKAPFDVYVGRPSSWGNPFSVRDHGNAAMRLYLDWLRVDPRGQETAVATFALRGKILQCWCTTWPAPNWKPCHAVVLARLANGEPLFSIRADFLERDQEQLSLFSSSQ